MNKKNVTNSYIASFCEQLYLLVKSGLPLDESVDLLSREDKNIESKELLCSMYETLSMGESLYVALKKTNAFPSYLVNMVKNGEMTGHLEEVLKSSWEYYERNDRLNSSIRNAVFYPVVLCSMMLVVIIVLLTKVVPIFNDVYANMGSSLSGFSLFFLKVGQFLNKASVPIVIILIALIGFVVYFFKSEKGKEKLSKKLNNSAIGKELNKARIASAISMGLSSGFDTEDSIDMALSIIQDDFLIEELNTCKEEMSKGERFDKALSNTNIFNEVDNRFLSVGLKSGSIETVMAQIASRSEETTNDKINDILSKIEPSLVLGLAIITGVILFSVMIPLVNIISLIG